MSHNPFEIGGPLAGLKLPLFPTQHGEEPGHPGCLPGGRYARPYQHPEHELYPGSVEHWRTCRPNFVPNRPFFDRQSQLQNWVAPSIPGASPGDVETYAAPVYWPQEWILQHYVAPAIPNEPGEARDRAAAESLHHLPQRTDRVLRAVPVVRCRPDSPVVRLDLGELDVGLYVVRVIGAVETAHIRPFRKPLFLRAAVNDGPDGEWSVSRLRLGYCDEFYDVGDVYFHADTKRRYAMTLQVDRGSEVDLLVHNISLDDVLAGCMRRPIKTRAIEPPQADVVPTPPTTTLEERLAHDALVWHGLPPLNFQGGLFPTRHPDAIPGVEPGTDTMTTEEIEQAHGAWRHSSRLDSLLVNERLGLSYSLDDYRSRRPLPAPYPFPDDGTGLVFPDRHATHLGRVWAPIGEALLARIALYCRDFNAGADAWREKGNSDAARDAAVKLIRFACLFPAMEDANMLTVVVHDPSAYGRGDRCRRRETGGAQCSPGFGLQFHLARAYDRLFTYIQGNEELAQSVGRFIPWVRTPADLVQFLDVYLLQTLAKRFLRYHYWGDGRQPAYVAELAAILGDNEVSRPWMEWLFHRTFYYARPPAGLPDYMVTALGREGRSQIASTSYVFGDSSAAAIAETLDLYTRHGGDPQYGLHDTRRFPKIVASLHFPLLTRTAGLWPMRLGNVSGPDKDYTQCFSYLLGEHAARGWRWTRDPGFAFILKHYGAPAGLSAEEWTEIDQAAATLTRAPWMDNCSRVIADYAAFLETGLQHDDFRFRRSVVLRVGTGVGHSHQDTLDLQIHAHGLPATVDAGQRPGYSVPGDKLTRLHNTVEVNGTDWRSRHAAANNQWDHIGGTNCWVRTLSDAEGARYLAAEVAPNPLTRFALRQVALIDADEGAGSQPLGPPAWGPDPSGLPPGVVTPTSYVFDVFRVSGGHTHTYCFHSHVNDPDPADPQPRTNAEEVARLTGSPVETEPGRVAAEYLREFSGERTYGVAPEHFVATFALQKQRKPPGSGPRYGSAGTESRLLRAAYDPAAPDKFTRLHLLGVKGHLVMRGELHCQRWDYRMPMIYVQRRGQDLESAFVAVIEPYAGRPFIRSISRLPVTDNDQDARQAVAIVVETVQGHRNWCFADGRPWKTRLVGDVQVAAEFAYCSVDAKGLRQATITGGTLLATPGVEIRAERAERCGRIVQVDYSGPTVWVDALWPPKYSETTVELVTRPADEPAAWRTSYTARSIQPEGDRTRMVLRGCPDMYRSRIVSVDEERGWVTAGLPLPDYCGDFRRGWTATDESGARRWRVAGVTGTAFQLDGGPVRASDFGPENVLRLWEFGLGDQVRQSTQVNLRRSAPGEFLLTADVGLEIRFPSGSALLITAEEIAGRGGTVRVSATKGILPSE